MRPATWRRCSSENANPSSSRRASRGSSFMTAASRCSRTGVGCASCRRSQRRRLTLACVTRATSESYKRGGTMVPHEPPPSLLGWESSAWAPAGTSPAPPALLLLTFRLENRGQVLHSVNVHAMWPRDCPRGTAAPATPGRALRHAERSSSQGPRRRSERPRLARPWPGTDPGRAFGGRACNGRGRGTDPGTGPRRPGPGAAGRSGKRIPTETLH